MHTISDDRWARLSEIVAETTGLHFPPERREDLQRGVTASVRELGFEDAAACAAWLVSTVLTPAQVRVLASHLTVGETYFFRERNAYDAFVDGMLPDIVRARRGRSQRLRIWSAGCCTGEEPYSLAMALHQALPDPSDWEIKILGTDINPRFLEKAAAGVYGDWSFRGESSGIRERFFRRTADGRYAVVPEIKRLVTFAPLNLMEDVYPSPATDTQAMDMIFCRNVLMYFAAASTKKVIRKMHDALIPGGWLTVSPSEASHALFPQFVQVNRPGVILYRKGVTDAASEAPIPSRVALDRAAHNVPPSIPSFDRGADAFPAAALTGAPRGVGKYAETAGVSPEPFDEHASAARSCAAQARMHADLGELEQALAWCDRWTAADKLNPGSHYLRAVILFERGRHDDARASLQRSLFLRPEFVLAHYTLGQLAWRSGGADEAHRHFINALRLLDGCAVEDVIPESDGLTAGRLIETITSMMDRETAP